MTVPRGVVHNYTLVTRLSRPDPREVRSLVDPRAGRSRIGSVARPDANPSRPLQGEATTPKGEPPMPSPGDPSLEVNRRAILAAGTVAGLGWAAIQQAEAAAEQRAGDEAPIAPKDALKITRLETLLVKPRWQFLKVHTNAGIVGLGEP